MDEQWECVIVGGGAAGLSAALVLGRARRRTLLVDAGQQSNRAAPGIGGLLGFDGVAPEQFYQRGRAEVGRYPSVELRDGEVVDVAPHEGGFTVRLADGLTEPSARVLLATGMRYESPDLPGLAELWGRSVFHCPFCHGWELRDEPMAVLADGERAVHLAQLLRGWTDDVVVLTSGAALTDATANCFAAGGVPVDERPIAALESAGGELAAVVFTDGERLPRRGLLVGTTLRQRGALAARLGLELRAPTPVSAEMVGIDAMYRTSMPGVFAAGDVSVQMPQVAAAIAAGSGAAAAVMASLVEEPRLMEQRR